ncbi:MAG TPA: FtsW/RodA/SpoVE family cell cycle protein, partial [Holophaga sp.]|nr:FtsW/RodA/SpoVE family cell cycle protein [Holophaga sp.]
MRERFRVLDPYLLVPMLLLMFMGTLTIFSASRGTSQSTIWLKQSVWNLLGFSLMLLVARLRLGRIFNWSSGFYVAGILLLVAVLVPGVGKNLGGAQRWISVGGLTFQPSELMKWLALLFVAHRL